MGAQHPVVTCGGCGRETCLYSLLDQMLLRSLPVRAPGHVGFGANLSVRNAAFSGRGMFVSGGYFGLLGIQPTIGRLLQPADDGTIGAHYVAVLRHEFWRERYGSDPRIVGQALSVNGKSLTILGVAEDGFRSTTRGAEPMVYVPVSMRAAVSSWRPALAIGRAAPSQRYQIQGHDPTASMRSLPGGADVS